MVTAPVTAIIAYDTKFYEHLHKTFPHDKTAPYWFSGEGKEQVAFLTAFRNGSLQGAYLMIAARAVGLDVGGMSGFDNAKVDAAFFPDGRFKSNFLCNLGYGDHAKLFSRSPRLEFDEAVTLAAESRGTRLGAGLQATGRLDPAAQERTLAAIADYMQIVREYGARVACIATSAI